MLIVIIDDEWRREAYIERAAILEYEAGMERKAAEALARRLVREEIERMEDAKRSPQ